MSEPLEPAVETAGDSFLQDLLATPALVLKRMGAPLFALVLCFVGGAVGYWFIGLLHGRHWSALDCIWMSVISLTTVGYGEAFPLDFPAARIYTMLLLIIGMCVTVWAVSSVTAFFVEGHLGLFFREKALEKHIESLSGHTVLCGLSPVSEHVLLEHRASGRAVVVVDARHEVAHPLRDKHKDLPVVVGDASSEEVLMRAGLQRARALVCCLPNDRDNLFLVVTARQLRKDLEIIVDCGDETSVPKFRAAGATHVVNPSFIGGMRIASQVLRPATVAFLDAMLRGPGEVRVTEVVVRKTSAAAGQSIAWLVEHGGMQVVALRSAGELGFRYSPPANAPLADESVVIVIGERERVARVEALAKPA
ncbi:MAG: potassium channel family protein [Deltaproteobacteria bacterium]|nr:potassium channel family protein [Deltaproteobacteria bacterium]